MEVETFTQLDMLEAFGITDPTPPATDPTPEALPPGDEPPAGAGPPADGAPMVDVDPAPAAPAPTEPANQMFAQMRVENKTYKNTLQNVANILGITDVKDPVALAEAIQAKALEAQSKKDNIPLEALQRLARLETLEQEMTQDKLRNQAITGFEQVAKTFGLAEKDVLAFAQQLTEQGMNPLEKPLDMVQAYRNLHWEELMANAIDKGRQEEAARAAKAGQHSTEPGTDVGGTPGAQDKIDTVKALDNLFNGLNI